MNKTVLTAAAALLLLGAGCQSATVEEPIDTTSMPAEEVIVEEYELYPFMLSVSGEDTASPLDEIIGEGYGSIYVYDSGRVDGSGVVYHDAVGECDMARMGLAGEICEVSTLSEGEFSLTGELAEDGTVVIDMEWEWEPYEMIAASGPQGSGQFYSLQKMMEESGMLDSFTLPLEYNGMALFDATGDVVAEGIVIVAEYELIEE